MNQGINTSDPLGTSILNYITWKLNKREQEKARDHLRKQITSAIRSAPVSQSEIPTDGMGTTVPDEAAKRSLSMLLASLHYSGMNDREERISKAHEKTFQWLFKDSDSDKWASFQGWLESGEKLYWITGKAGSGKSTLMKFICHPDESAEDPNRAPQCRKFLTTWSGDQRLVIASFYFWNSGIQMQMTQRGLLISILHQIIEQCPEVAPLASSDRWECLSLFGEYPFAWEDQELYDTVCRVAKSMFQINSSLVLFVDGLDEFEGKPEELIALFKDIVDCSNVKICVASRPWIEFQDAFQHRPSLMLEDLTYDDIKSFVTARFNGEPMFAQLRLREEAFADQLIDDIVVKAAGVFLWVKLVVSSLIAGMGSGDRVSDFMKRLDQLPPDLSKLYEKMLLSLDPFYLDHAAQLFDLVRTSSYPMNLVLASFVDEDDPDFALRQPCSPLSDEEAILRMDTMRRRINSRSKGLLEAKGPLSTAGGFKHDDPLIHSRYTVQYLHRTVKDYIESEKAQAILRSQARSPFDPHLRLLAGHIAYIKSVDLGKFFPLALWDFNFNACFKLAKSVFPDSIPQMILLLDELDKVGPTIFLALAAKLREKMNRDNPLPKSCLWPSGVGAVADLERQAELGNFNRGFLSMAVGHGIIQYVRVKAEAPCLIGKWPLLMDTLVSPSGRYASPDRRMIECLLQKSADPNYLNQSDSVPLLTGRSPLIMSVEALILLDLTVTIIRPPDDMTLLDFKRSLVEATRLLARAGRLDKETIDRALEHALVETGLGWPRFRLDTLIPWSRARKALRKSLQTLINGEDIDISRAIAHIEVICRNRDVL